MGWIQAPTCGDTARGTEDWVRRGLAQATLRVQGWPPTQLSGSRLAIPTPRPMHFINQGLLSLSVWVAI